MSSFYSVDQRVYLRRDPSQFGRIGTSPTGAYYDCETRSQDVFWENPGNDIVTAVAVADLMGEQELSEHRRLFFAAMRRPEMRVLRLALRSLQWDHGIDWRQITELELCPYGQRGECCMVVTERCLLVCLDAKKPDLTYEDFFFTRLHEAADPECTCEDCERGIAYRACNGCHEQYAFGSCGLTRQLMLTYCCATCAVESGMRQEEADRQMSIRVTLLGELVD